MSNRLNALYLSHVIDNDPASSARHYAAAACLRTQLAEIERLSGVVSKVNKHCDHLGIRLGEVMRERDALLEALEVARRVIAHDRESLVECSATASGAIDSDAIEHVNYYNAAIKQIDAAIEKVGGGNG